MKFSRLFALSLLVTGLTAGMAADNQPAAPAAAKPAAAPVPVVAKPTGVVKAVETSRVAAVNTAAFLADAGGIKTLVRAAQALDLEFTSTQSELSLLNEKLRTLVGELQKLSADKTANAKAIEEKQAEGQKLQQELQQKQQAAQQAYQQRQQETLAPLMQKVGDDLQAYAKDRDISLLLDLSKIGESVLFIKPEVDVTADFVNYYNAKNP